MTLARQALLLTTTLLLAACGGNEEREVNCEANLVYQNRVEYDRVVAPDDLDQLNPLAEMPVPRADPNAPKMPEGVCNDRPPRLSTGG